MAAAVPSSASAAQGCLAPSTALASRTADASSTYSSQSHTDDKDKQSISQSSLALSPSASAPTSVSASLRTSHSASSSRHDAPARRFNMALIPEARPDNDYLGFCRGVYNLQNGDRAAALQKAKEGGAYSRSGAASKNATAYFQKCKEPRCAFRSNFVSTDANMLWIKTFEFPERGLKLRWTFLAKSHVPQRVVLHNKHSYKCLFCVYQNVPEATVYSGMEAYLDHVSAVHRGKEMDPVLQYKTRCLTDRIAEDREQFDINLWPSTACKDSMKVSEWLSDDYLDPAARQRKATIDSASSYYLTGIKPAESMGQHDDDNEDEDDAIETVSVAARAGRLFAPSRQFRHVDPALNPLAPTQTPSSGWEDIEGNPWAEAVTSADRAQIQPRREDVGAQQSLAESPVDMLAPVPQIPPRSQLRSYEAGMQQLQQSFAQTSISEESMSVHLSDIVQIYTEALGIVNDMVQEAARNMRISPSPLLQFALSDAPPEILKLQQRGLGLFGPSFDAADDSTITTLQRTSRELHTRLFRPLKQAARDPNYNDYHALLQYAEQGQQTTVAVLKQRLARLHATNDASPHSLQPPSGHSPSHSRASSSQDLPRLTHYSNDSYSAPDSERQASSASTNSNPHPAPALPEAHQRRTSMLGFLKHGIKSHSDHPAPAGGGKARAEGGLSGMVKLDFRHHHRKVAPTEEGYGQERGAHRAIAELDSTPVVPGGPSRK